jgi:nitroreductase
MMILLDLLPELKRRKSPLIFKQKNIEPEKVRLLIEAARWAPSCFNNQSWNYVFVHKTHQTRRSLEAALSYGNSWAKKAPYLVTVGADPEADCKMNNLPYYAYNAGLSVMSLVVEAEHQGIQVHQMAGWDEEKVKYALGFPESYRVIVLFALGYGEDATRIWDQLEEKLKTKLTKGRERKPIKDNFFMQSFGNPMTATN